MSMDSDPARIPDLEPGGGVAPGSTPPETAQTSGLSAPEPRTRHHFPFTGVVALVAIAVLVIIFLGVAVGLLI
ncbi:DUF6480 family protein [Nocardia huaxiensis]|uniref:DUF6480 family protein n=1 Tax=Nocardia huaxiensis TaxID=2755382 RepID=UPI001E52A31A|nr:DUF6480 family protein [Nocardia huaxiensis]UFS97068.1 DUF6480 family protein [Nocardia huaxiensis]